MSVLEFKAAREAPFIWGRKIAFSTQNSRKGVSLDSLSTKDFLPLSWGPTEIALKEEPLPSPTSQPLLF